MAEMREGTPSKIPGMRRMRCYRADVTGDTTHELELAALAKAEKHLPGVQLEMALDYSFGERTLTLREIRTAVAEGPGKELQAQIRVWEIVPEEEL
jgi:hypothetical protein